MNQLLSLILGWLLISSSAAADTIADISSELIGCSISATLCEAKNFPEVELTKLQLANGMTVWLKPTNFETDEISIKLIALGGYAALSDSDLPSGEMAASIAWESGMGEYSSDQVSVLLYEHSLDFIPKIQAFSRSIEGVSRNKDLEIFLMCVEMFFTQQKFTDEGLKAALAHAKDSILKQACDYDQVYEAAFLQVNTQDFHALKPMTIDDVFKVNYKTAKDFFYRSFANPADFACVIVGSFDINKTKVLLEKYLAQISKKSEFIKSDDFFKSTFSHSRFPPGITEKVIQISNRPDALTHITFPWQKPMTERKIYKMAFACQIIEARLRRVITEKMHLSYGVDVSYGFPYFPYSDNPWISIRFRSDLAHLEEVKALIMQELANLQEKGVVKSEIEEIKQLEAGSDAFWLRNNTYWMQMLANYYLWQWDPQWIYLGAILTQDLTPEYINNLLQTGFSMENYSVVTAKP